MGRRRDRYRAARVDAPGGKDHARHADDIDSEVLAGFLHALRTADLTAPRLWLRLCWATWRAGAAAITALRMRRRRAEHIVAAAIARGDLPSPALFSGGGENATVA
ncbi:hypothetical protein [Micromonospora sonchi]|uniref:hypothetical protein n=1 Tax=Micromonospora sonchi TaxID=1763543 RepID=UPI001E4C19BE|nr:hypothetical protein [Micromonospora sonchi]